jgi:hypothetical protein
MCFSAPLRLNARGTAKTAIPHVAVTVGGGLMALQDVIVRLTDISARIPALILRNLSARP